MAVGDEWGGWVGVSLKSLRSFSGCLGGNGWANEPLWFYFGFQAACLWLLEINNLLSNHRFSVWV